MRKTIGLLILSLPVWLNAQITVAVKAGVNLSVNPTSSDFTSDLRFGYFIGGSVSPKIKKVLGYRSEIMLSRQGYDYRSSSSSGHVNLDYLLLPQLLVLKFTKKVQLQLGGQLAFLLNARVDSSGAGNGSLLDYLDRFDYGVTGGVEVSPLGGFFIGIRASEGLKNLVKPVYEGPIPGNYPGFIPKNWLRNRNFQIFTGWRF
ncbi:MAG: outer membrane beta-barrel protein [Chitinophagaceae bacterium]